MNPPRIRATTAPRATTRNSERVGSFDEGMLHETSASRRVRFIHRPEPTGPSAAGTADTLVVLMAAGKLEELRDGLWQRVARLRSPRP